MVNPEWRNLSIALALSILLLGENGGSASLLSSLAFLIQVQGAAWYVMIEENEGTPANLFWLLIPFNSDMKPVI